METFLPFLLIKCKIVKTKDIFKNVNRKLKRQLILSELNLKKKIIIQNSFGGKNSQEQEHHKKQTKHKFTIYSPKSEGRSQWKPLFFIC